MEKIPATYWKIIIGVGVIITLLSLISLPSLYENISGDSIPNRPQRELPIEYQWDIAITRIVIAFITIAISIYSIRQLRTT